MQYRNLLTLLLVLGPGAAAAQDTESPFVWAESATPGEGLVGRWQNQAHSTRLEVHPDGRYRWLGGREGEERCTYEGSLRVRREQARFYWRGDGTDDVGAHEAAHAGQLAFCGLGAQPGVSPRRPPLGTGAQLFFLSDDEVVLVYEEFAYNTEAEVSALVAGRPRRAGWTWLRLVRAGSAADTEARRPEGANYFRGSSLLFDGRRWGLLQVDGGSREAAAYTLRWHRGRSERGRLRCEGRRCEDQLVLGRLRLRGVRYPTVWQHVGRASGPECLIIQRRWMN